MLLFDSGGPRGRPQRRAPGRWPDQAGTDVLVYVYMYIYVYIYIYAYIYIYICIYIYIYIYILCGVDASGAAATMITFDRLGKQATPWLG